MRSTQIRQTFTDFFTSRGHHPVPSSSLVPDDPTLLLAGAGMNQFKPYFLGETTPTSPCDQHPEMRPHLRHRERRPYRPARDVLRDDGQLLLR